MQFPVNNVHTESDFRLEILANELLESGVNLDQILVTPLGEFIRGFRKDIADLGIIEDQLGNPLHDNLDDILNETEQDPVEAIKKNRKEEAAARKFFQIVENEFFRLRILFEKEERKTIIGTPQFDQHEIFMHLWQELNNLDSRYIVPLMQILPLVTKYQMRLNEVEQFLFFLLRIPVAISMEDRSQIPIPLQMESCLGNTHLAVDSILSSVFFDFDPAFRLKIGPLSPAELEDFMPGMPAAMALDVFIQYFFPIKSQILMDFVLDENVSSLFLNSNHNTSTSDPIYSRLGLSAII
jgi:hypothetical protein